MPANSSRSKFLIDVDPNVVLKTPGTVTSTTIETSVPLNELDDAYWQDGEIPKSNIRAVVHVTAMDRTTADETYVLDLIVDDASAQNDSPVVIASLTLTGKPVGVYEILADPDNIPKLDADTSGSEKYLAIRATLGGTTPSITYGAWLAKPPR